MTKHKTTTDDITDDVRREALFKALKTVDYDGQEIPVSRPTPQILLDLANLEKEIERNIEPDFVQAIKKVCYHIQYSGLPFEEACLIERKNPELMKELMEEVPAFAELVRIKNLEYKNKLLGVLSSKANEGDVKTATYLLDYKYDIRTGDKRRSGNDDNEKDPVSIAINFIQETSESSSPINAEYREISSTRNTDEKKKQTAHDLLE